jgi:hypothetical protein
MNSASALRRQTVTVLLALILAMRLLTPVGFMPTFDGGKLTIAECPGDAPIPMPDMPGMRHDHRNSCQSCPHATASGGGLVEAQPFAVASDFLPDAPLLGGPSALPPGRSSDHDWPPSIGPPLIA